MFDLQFPLNCIPSNEQQSTHGSTSALPNTSSRMASTVSGIGLMTVRTRDGGVGEMRSDSFQGRGILWAE